MYDLSSDLSREEIFNTTLFSLLKDHPVALRAIFRAHAGQDIGATASQLRHRDRGHVLRGKKIEFDLFFTNPKSKILLIVELKGVGGSEISGQTTDIEEVAVFYYPEWSKTLLYATPEGNCASSNVFRNLTLFEFVAPLQSLAPSIPEISAFLLKLQHDLSSECLQQRREEITAKIKNLAGKLEKKAEAVIASTAMLAGFEVDIVRGYARHTACVHIQPSKQRWAGLRFSFDIKQLDGRLVGRAEIIKHCERNVTTLKALRRYFDDHPISAWLDDAQITETEYRKFSAKNLALVVLNGFEGISDDEWCLHLEQTLEKILLPSVKALDAFFDDQEAL